LSWRRAWRLSVLGTITVADDKVTLKLADGIEMFNARSDTLGFNERTLKTDLNRRDWVYLGRLSFHVIKRDDNRYILRVADQERPGAQELSPGGSGTTSIPSLKIDAKFVPYTGKKIDIVNVLGEVSQEDVRRLSRIPVEREDLQARRAGRSRASRCS
jgi:hypothetical protein